MPFGIEKENSRKKAFLRIEMKLSNFFKKHSPANNVMSQRVSLFNSLGWVKGSLTVEAAVVVTMFLFAMISLLYFCEIMRYSDLVESSLHQTAKAMAVKAYAAKYIGDGDLGPIAGSIGGVALSQTYVAANVSKNLQASGIKTGKISYLRSSIMNNDIIDLIAVEELKPLYDICSIGTFRIMDRARVHAFTGYDNTKTEAMEANEEIVYVTESGSVYHSSRNCSHLKVSVTTISAEALKTKRNKSGGKYYPCEYCPGTAAANYYITEYGDAYHTKANCQGLKRNVMAVPISKVSGKAACKTCGR